MTALQQQAFAEAAKLSPAEQDLLASRVLAEIAAEDAFDEAIKASAGKLVGVAAAAVAEHRSGHTQPLDPEHL